MRSSSIVLAVALVSAAPSLAAPVPQPAARADVSVPKAAETKLSTEILGFFAGIVGSISGKAAANVATGNNADGTPASRRELDERSLATDLLKPLLKSAASSAAVEGFLDGVQKLFGGDSSSSTAAPAAREFDERSLATDLLKPLLKSAASSAAVEGFFDGIKKLFPSSSSSSAPASRRAAPTSGADLIAQVQSSSLFTQDQLDEVESELAKVIPAGLLRRDLEARLSLKVGTITKALLGLIGSVAGSSGIDALFGGDSNNSAAPASRRAAPTSGDELIAQVQSSSLFTQDQLDEVESELAKVIPAGLLRRDLEARLSLKIGTITKALLGLIGSVAGSSGIDAIFGGSSSNAAAPTARALDFASLHELD